MAGIDIAGIGEIGRHLNIPTDLQFAFEGLPGALLQINQSDLAIATMVSITDFKHLAAYRVGVQRGIV